MISTPRDNNHVPTLLATSNADGVTVISALTEPVVHRLVTSDGTGGTGFPFVNSQRDANRVSAIWGVSSADGVTPIPIYCTPDGKLLTQST